MAFFRKKQGRQRIPRRIDFKRGAVEYLQNLDESTRYYHYTKPYVGGPDYQPYLENLRDLYRLTLLLDLPMGSRVLEVGCGPGWVCERLGRLGHSVLGLDISPDMIEIARQRLEAIRYGPYTDRPMNVRYEVADAESFELQESFDAVILLSTLHHIEDVEGCLRSVFRHLEPGGRLFISEGVMPPDDSVWAEENRRLMTELATLESPFEPEHLCGLLEQAGFQRIRRFRDLPDPLEIGLETSDLQRLTHALQEPTPLNLILALKPLPGRYFSDQPGLLRGAIESPVTGLEVAAGQPFHLPVHLTNRGDTVWLHRCPGAGFVTLRARLLDPSGQILEELAPASELPHDLEPGDSLDLEMQLRIEHEPGDYILDLDLVSEFIAWFSERGSETLRIPLRIRPEA